MAAHPRRKTVLKPEAGAEEAAGIRRFHLPHLATMSTDFRTLFINLCILTIFLVMIPVIGLQFLRSQVIIDTIAVPPGLIERGLSAEVAANRLWDGLHDAEVMAASSKSGITAIPKNQRVDFSIPDAGISIDSLVYYVRQFFNIYQTRITGEFRCADPQCSPEGMSLRIRILRDRLDIIQMPPIGGASEVDYFRDAALRVLEVLDPFIAAAARSQSHPDAAQADAERLVHTHSPDATWAYNLIGNIRIGRGDTEGAIAAFRGALALDPDFVIAKTNLGSALVAQKEFSAAAKVFDEVARLHPDDRFLALGRYRLALAQNQTDAAVALVMQADALDPGKPTYPFLAAQALYAANRIPEATSQVQRALDLAPDDYGSVFLLSLIYQSAGEVEQAAGVLQRALALSPDQPDFLGLYAQTLAQLHKFDESLASIDRALALQPATQEFEIARASTLQALGRHQDALAQLDSVAKNDPGNSAVALLQGQSFESENRREDALLAYRRAITLAPDSTDAMIAQMHIDLLQKSD